MAHEWKNKVVLITGAATAIGAAVVEILLRENVKVGLLQRFNQSEEDRHMRRQLDAEITTHVAVLDINEKAGVALQNKLNTASGNKVKFYKCDVTDEEQFLGIFKAVMAEQGYIDVVINNAGIMNDGLHVYKKMIDVNITALTTGTLKSIELMSKENGGRGGTVINISSICAMMQDPPIFPIYNGTKSFVLQFSNCLGNEEYYSRNGVRIIAMCYGATDTPLLHLNHLGSFDKSIEKKFEESLSQFPFQKKESAAQGLVDAYKQGKTGSTWLSLNDLPVKDITATITKAYNIMSEEVLK